MAFALVVVSTKELSLAGVAVMFAVYGMLPLEGDWVIMTTFGDDVIFNDAVISRL